MDARTSKLGALAIKSLIGLIVIANIVFYSPLLKVIGMVLVGKTQCSIRQILDGGRYLTDHARSMERIAQRMRLVRTVDACQLWDTPHGAFWVPGRTGLSFAEQLAEREHNLYSGGRHSVLPGDVVLDCGANIGVFTRTALSAGAQTVVAIEPAPDVVECLRRTFADEIKGDRVIVYPKGVWNKNDVLLLQQSQTSVADSFVVKPRGGYAGGPRVEVTTIDGLVS